MDGELRWRAFTAVVVAAGIALLWSYSVPGFGYQFFVTAVVVLAVTGVPLTVRWGISRPAFEAQVAGLPKG